VNCIIATVPNNPKTDHSKDDLDMVDFDFFAKRAQILFILSHPIPGFWTLKFFQSQLFQKKPGQNFLKFQKNEPPTPKKVEETLVLDRIFLKFSEIRL
jgi:hypothetical protein